MTDEQFKDFKKFASAVSWSLGAIGGVLIAIFVLLAWRL